MTDPTGCLEKVFSPPNAACGESTARNCCQGSGGPTQDSFAMVGAALGAAASPAQIFRDGFGTFQDGADPANPDEVGSTCRWDLGLGGPASLPPAGGEPPAPGLTCGTDVAHPQRSR